MSFSRNERTKGGDIYTVTLTSYIELAEILLLCSCRPVPPSCPFRFPSFQLERRETVD